MSDWAETLPTVAALLSAIAGSKDGNPLTRAEAVEEVAQTARVVEDLGRPPRVLWVDARPSNNCDERTVMQRLGVLVERSTSTEEALVKIAARGPCDVIISDMGRPPDPRAGYAPLDQLRSQRLETPYVIYASSRRQEHFDESVRHGAIGCTNRPDELIDMVRAALSVAG